MVRRFVLNSEKDRASISAGVPIQSVAMSEELSEPSSAQALPETPVEPVVEAVAGEPEVAAEAPAVVEEAPATSQPGPVADSGQFSSYLNTLTAQIETLRTENTSLREAAIRHSLATEAKDAEMENLRATLPVLRKAIARLEIGLGHRESKLEGASPSMLIETYESLYAELMNLPTGRKSEPPASEPNPLSDLVAQRIASISH